VSEGFSWSGYRLQIQIDIDISCGGKFLSSAMSQIMTFISVTSLIAVIRFDFYVEHNFKFHIFPSICSVTYLNGLLSYEKLFCEGKFLYK